MDALALARRSAALIVTAGLCLLAGCNVIGAVAQLAGPPDVGAGYTNLKGQTVGVIVWVDRGIKIDYPAIGSDVAKSLTDKLAELTQPKDKKTKPRPEMVGIQYLDPAQIINFQNNHPELEGAPPKDIATRLGVTRVISIELKDFQTKAPRSPDLFKGQVVSTMQIWEVTPGPNKVATLGYDNPNLETSYPSDRPEGIPFGDITGQIVYDKTIDQYTTEIAQLFFRHADK